MLIRCEGDIDCLVGSCDSGVVVALEGGMAMSVVEVLKTARALIAAEEAKLALP